MDLLDIGLYAVYIMVAVGAIGALVLSLINIASKPGGLLRAGIGIGALVVLFFIAYLLASDEVSLAQRAIGTSSGTSKLVGAALIMAYIAFIGAVIALIFSEISKAFR